MSELKKLVEKWNADECQHSECDNAICEACAEKHGCASELTAWLPAHDARVRESALEEIAQYVDKRAGAWTRHNNWGIGNEIRALAANPQAVLKQPDSVAAAYRAGQYDTVNYLLTLKPKEFVQAVKDMKAGLEPVVNKDKRL